MSPARSGPAGPIATADGTLTLRAGGHGETYRSVHGAARESRTVFVEGSGVAARLEAGRPTRVLELGFGIAWNFLLSAERARASGTALDYLAFERAPLDAATLARLEHERALGERVTLDALLAALRAEEARAAVAGAADIRGRGVQLSRAPVRLELRATDLRGSTLPSRAFDAIYLDPFSPAAEPDAWSVEVLAALADALAPGGTLASYSVQGRLRRELAVLGLVVDKRPGPPGKRERLVATRPPTPSSASSTAAAAALRDAPAQREARAVQPVPSDTR